MSSGGKGAKAPKAPDYAALAAQQGQINQQTAEQLTAANRPNQYDAFGNSITWNRTVDPAAVARAQQEFDAYYATDEAYQGGPGVQDKIDRLRANIAAAQQGTNWEQRQTLSPEIKGIWDKYISDAGSAGSKYGDILNQFLGKYQAPEDMEKFQQRELVGSDDPRFSGKAVSDALYGSVMDRGRVEQGRETEALNSQLRQQGLVPGSQAYNRAMQNLMTSQNDANLLAGQNATLAGADESRRQYASYLAGQGQGFNQDLSSYGANFNTELSNRNQPLQELAGMAGIAGGQPYQPTHPGFSGATGYNPTDLVGAANAQYGAKANAANASNSKKGGLLGAGASLGGSYLGSK